MSFSGFIGVVALATLEGALVALPRRDALEQLGRLRSPIWAALLPGSIVLGTFGVLALPSMAVVLAVLAGVATLLLTAVAMVTVVRGPRTPLLLTAIALAVTAGLVSGWIGELSTTALTALGCLPLGVALVRLIPSRWVVIGVLCMCGVDVALLAAGVGQTAGAVMANATTHIHAPVFDRASIGPITIDYPDLVLASLLGGVAARDGTQPRAAVLVTTFAAGYGMLLPLADTLPATVPIGLIFILLRWRQRPRHSRAARSLEHPRAGASRLPCSGRPCSSRALAPGARTSRHRCMISGFTAATRP
jgi:hypothetical protein